MTKTLFDYNVVGAGTWGCALTSRLVESNFKFLLLEAGNLIILILYMTVILDLWFRYEEVTMTGNINLLISNH